MLYDMLNLTDVQIKTYTTSSNGMGGSTSTTALTTLNAAAIWQNGSGNKIASYLNEKIAKNSTHVLVTLPEYHDWTSDDLEVLWNDNTYKVVGPADDIMGMGEIIVVGLELRR